MNDTWRPNPGLTVNLGLRWEGQWNPQAPETDQGLQSKNPDNPGLDTIGLVQGDIPNDLNNIAPRFGIAWDPNNDGKTVVRGGAGYLLLPHQPAVDGELVHGQRRTGRRCSSSSATTFR